MTQPSSSDGTRVAGVRDLPAVLFSAGRLVARHWPALLTLAFLGVAVRAGALWAAVRISDWNSFAGQLFLLLPPLGYLLPIIAMLHLCRESLPNVSALADRTGPQASTEGRERRLVDVAVSVLVPFFAVYVSYGLLDADRERFLNEAAFAEFNQFDLAHPPDYDYAGRLGIYPLQVVAMIVVLAWLLRWALGRIEHRTRFLALAFLGALVEVYWTSQVARQSFALKTTGRDWAEHRRAVDWVTTRYDDVVGRLGVLAHPVDSVTGWVGGLVGSLDAVVVVPIAWLTVGAVVLGHKLADERPAAEPVGPAAERTGRLRSLLRSVLADLHERWSAFWAGLRLLAAAGLLPMLAFCLTFLLAIRIPWAVSELVRAAVGPVDTSTWLAFSPMETSLGLALSMALTAPLLAAALDWLVAPRVRALSVAGPGSRTPAS